MWFRSWGLRSILAGLFAFLSACTVPQQQRFFDVILGRVGMRDGGYGQEESAKAPPSPTAVPAATPASSEAEQILMLWQRAMTEHPQMYLDCLKDAQCGPALRGYLVRLQQQTSHPLELPAVYDPYGLREWR